MRLISNELASLIRQQGVQGTQVNMYRYGGTQTQGYIGTQGNIQENRLTIGKYFKRRTIAIVFDIAVLIILLTSSVFTDFGFRIGEYVLSWFGL